MTGLTINTGFLEMKWNPKTEDQDAVWELYVALLTRITTQPLPQDVGDEQNALDSVHSIFRTTREIIKSHGKECIQFIKIEVIVLNQIIRPFTTKYHKVSIEQGFSNTEIRNRFRKELEELQKKLRTYSKMLADMAKVEDLTTLAE